MSKVSQNIAARVDKLVADAPADTPTTNPTPGSASDASAGAPPPASEAAGADSGAGKSPGQPATLQATGEPAPDAQKTQHAILEEKLAETRARRQAQRESAAARSEREAASKEREQAEAARKDYESKRDAYRKGNIRQALLADGEDPREFFEKMAEEAREAGKPETVIRAMREKFDTEIAEAKKEIADLRKEREAEREQQKRTVIEEQFAGDLGATIQRPEFVPLLIEYEPEQIHRIAITLRDNPQRLFAEAKRLNVKLTAAAGRFNMLDICNVMHATHAAHEAAKEQRRARWQAPASSEGAQKQAPANTPTVNGTAEKRNAANGNPLGNDAAAARSTEKLKPRESRQRRVDRLINGG